MNFRHILFLTLMILSSKSSAFVENVTHGYPACIACHTSPSGGGVLTDYGRSLSKELMSTWGGWDGMEEPAFGGLKSLQLDGLRFGGDVRGIQTYFENGSLKRGSGFLMQNNVEVAATAGAVTFVGTAGTQEGPDTIPGKGQFLSERHYVLWSPDPTSRMRVGKYRQNFGINTPNHNRLIKSRFGFGALSETYNVEYTKFNENYEVSLGASLGRIDRPRNLGSEKNLSASFVHYLQGRSRLGGSLLFGESSVKRRMLTSLFSVLPLGKHWLGLFELDYETAHFASDPSSETKTLASMIKVGNKPAKGLLWYLLFEHASQDSGAGYDLTHAPGIGIQWLPLPHFNIQVEYQRSVLSANAGDPNHVGWVLFHFYH